MSKEASDATTGIRGQSVILSLLSGIFPFFQCFVPHTSSISQTIL